MRKQDEISDPTSCLSRARPGEMVFVLLARDKDAPATIRYWISRRQWRGKDIGDAVNIARTMEDEQRAAKEESIGVASRSVVEDARKDLRKAVQKALDHFGRLMDKGALTREEEPVLQALREAVER